MPDAPTLPDLAPFSAWLRSQHLRADAVGSLAAALRGDPDGPDPASGPELFSYLVSTNASAETHHVAAVAWSFFEAEQHRHFVDSVTEYAELWAAEDEPAAARLSVGDLLDELDFERDGAAEEAAAGLLCDLAPYLLIVSDVIVRVQRGTVTLAYLPGSSELGVRRYGGTQA